MDDDTPELPHLVNDGKLEGKLPKFIIVAIVILFISLGCRFYMVTSPPLPKYDPNEWWGPHPINGKADKSIRPYTIEFDDAIVNDLKERLLHRRPFTPPLRNSALKYGVNTDFMTRVLDFWQNNYNVAERVNFLNKFNHFVTKIQGLDIHFIHVKPQTPNVLVVPLLLLHSWPTSVREFYEIIPLLTTQQAEKNFVFEVIVPSLPGFGFSQAPARDGMNRLKIAVILNNLMKRLGFEQYYVHGGEFGQTIGSVMATAFPNRVLGLHINTPIINHELNGNLVFQFSEFCLQNALYDPEVRDYLKNKSRLVEKIVYFRSMVVRPDTLGIALTESPAGLAAYIIEHFSYLNKTAYKSTSDGGLLKKFSLTQLVDNIMIYWMTNSITSSMRVFHDYVFANDNLDQIRTRVPTWGMKFKTEAANPDCLLKIKYRNYVQSTFIEDVSHFPAIEHTQLLADDIYDAVAAIRQYREKEMNEPEINKTPEPEVRTQEQEKIQTVYDFNVKDIQGNDVSLEKYRGKVLIIVNVASQCGYTDTHYTQLNELYEKYSGRGLRILAFPCNQFGGQEPGTLKDILQFTQKRNVKFDVFEKIEVNGENTHPLWEFLKKSQGGTLGDFIKWNFSKFIVDRSGLPVERFGPNVNPLDLEPYLEKYW